MKKNIWVYQYMSMKNEKFISTKETYKKKMSDWPKKCLLGSEKETQIKSFMQAIPTHAMSISIGLCDDLMKLVRQFW